MVADPQFGAVPPKARSARAEREALLRWAFEDYRRFCALLWILPKNGQRSPLRLNEIQQAYCAARTRRDVILKARQVGMTTEEQARDIWHMLTRPGGRVTLMCQSIDDADSPARVMARNYNLMFASLRELGLRLNFGKGPNGVWILPESDAILRIVEAGASQAAAGKKGRGGVVTRLHTTETAFWEYATDSLNAMVECVPDEPDTEIVHESTPNGAAGKFHEDYQAAARKSSGFTAHFYPWFFEKRYSTPLEPGEVVEPKTAREERLLADGCTLAQLKWYRTKVSQKGQDLVDQEYPSDPETCFLVAGRPFFDRDALKKMLAAAQDPARAEKMGTRGEGLVRIWHQPIPGFSYILAADTAQGLEEKWSPESELAGGEKSKHDASAGIVIERDTGRHMATLWGLFRPGDFAAALAPIGHHYSTAQIAIERNNHGHSVLRALDAEQHYPRIYRGKDQQPGWNNHATSRTPALATLEQDIRAGMFTTPDRAVIGQLLTFVYDKNDKATATKGAHDDLVMATAIAWDINTKPERHRHEEGSGWTSR